MLVALISVTAIAGMRPTTTYRAIDLGANTFEIGLVQSAVSILPALTAVAIGRWIDRRGEAGMYTFALIVLAIGGILSALATDLVQLAFGQSLVGFGSISAFISGQAMVVNRTRPDDWNRRYGTYAAFLSMGQLVGPSAAAAIQEIPALGAESERAVFLAAALAAFAAAVLTRVIPPGPKPAASVAGSQGSLLAAVRRVLRRPGMFAAMFVSVSVASTVDVLAAYLPVYGTVTNLPVQLVGLILSVRAAATMISRVSMDALLHRFGWQAVLVGCLATSGAMLALLPTTAVPALLLGIAAVLGLAIGMVQPMTITWVATQSPKAERGTALAVRLTGNRISLLMVPAIMGAVAGSAGVGAVFWFLAAALGVGSLVSRTARLDVPGREPRA